MNITPLVAVLALAGCAHGPGPAELAVLGDALDLRPGATIADLGAGDGQIAVALARRVGAGGAVVASELGAAQRKAIAERARGEGLGNVTVVEASQAQTGLADGCCDAILMRGVYHHLTQPEATLAGIVAALKPGGRLVVVDFAPSVLLAPWPSAENRGGHGVRRDEVVSEARRAGLRHVSTVDRYPGMWPLGPYAVVFRKEAQP